MMAYEELGAGRGVRLRALHECDAAQIGRGASRWWNVRGTRPPGRREGKEDPVTPVPVNTRAEAWFTHIGNLDNAGTAFRCRDGYIEPVNAGQGPVASGSANAFSARGV